MSLAMAGWHWANKFLFHFLVHHITHVCLCFLFILIALHIAQQTVDKIHFSQFRSIVSLIFTLHCVGTKTIRQRRPRRTGATANENEMWLCDCSIFLFPTQRDDSTRLKCVAGIYLLASTSLCSLGIAGAVAGAQAKTKEKERKNTKQKNACIWSSVWSEVCNFLLMISKWRLKNKYLCNDKQRAMKVLVPTQHLPGRRVWPANSKSQQQQKCVRERENDFLVAEAKQSLVVVCVHVWMFTSLHLIIMQKKTETQTSEWNKTIFFSSSSMFVVNGAAALGSRIGWMRGMYECAKS